MLHNEWNKTTAWPACPSSSHMHNHTHTQCSTHICTGMYTACWPVTHVPDYKVALYCVYTLCIYQVTIACMHGMTYSLIIEGLIVHVLCT